MSFAYKLHQAPLRNQIALLTNTDVIFYLPGHHISALFHIFLLLLNTDRRQFFVIKNSFPFSVITLQSF